MEGCPFCEKIKDKTEFESKYCYIVFDEYPVSAGHMLVIPKRHAKSYFDYNEDEMIDIWKCVDQAKHIIEFKYQTNPPQGYNIGINVGEVAGQTVPHCHVHIIPRYKDDVIDPRGGVRGVIPDKRIYQVKNEELDKKLKYKTLCTEYIIANLIDWFNEYQNKKFANPLNRQKFEDWADRVCINKMIFLLAAINTNKDEDLLDIYDNFYAQTTGPMDADVYRMFVYEKLTHYRFKERTCQTKPITEPRYFDAITPRDLYRINKAFKLLKEKNYELISYPKLKIIEVVRQWDCWRLSYKIAKELNTYESKIDIIWIREETNRIYGFTELPNIRYPWNRY